MSLDKTAIIYARVSTVRQADEELPIDSQLEQCHRKASELGARVVRVFRDDGKSGRYDNRPAFQAAIHYCEVSAPSFLITWSSSRFARNIEDAIIYKRRLISAGVNLTYVSLDVDTDTVGGFALDHVMALFDDIYSRQVSADTKRSMMKNARDGYYNGGAVPLGYVPVPADDNRKRKRLKPVSSEAEIVREIFSLKVAGHGVREIAIRMNADNKLNRGRFWNKTSVSSLLRNRSSIGQIVFGKKDGKTGRLRPVDQWIIVDAHEPIIDRSIWEEVQGAMDMATFQSDHGSPVSTFIFSGLLKCGKCGSSMQIETAKGRSKRYSYYNCRAAQRSGECENRRISARDFDQWLVDEISTEIFNVENLSSVISQLHIACSEWSTVRRSRRKMLLVELSCFEQKNSNLYDVMERLGKDTPNLGDLTRRLRDNNSAVERIEQELNALDAERPPRTNVTLRDVKLLSSTMVDILKTTGDPKKSRQFFSSFIRGIYIESEDVRLEYDPQMIVDHESVHSMEGWLPAPDVLGTTVVRFSLPKRFVRVAA